MKLVSIIIPVYNEAKTIKKLLSLVKSIPLKNLKKEIIVINDGSTDDSDKVLEKVKGITLINFSKNRGKGAAMSAGISKSNGDFIITQDADLEYDPSQYPDLLRPLLNGKSEVVYGSRYLYLKKKHIPVSWLHKAHPGSYYLSYLGARLLTKVANLLYGIEITDEATGYKVFTRKVANQLIIESKRFNFCPEITAKIARLGYKIVEVPIAYIPRTYEDGKKINWLDGLEGLWTLIKYRFAEINYPKSQSTKTNTNLEAVSCGICNSNDSNIVYPELPEINNLNPKKVFSSSSHSISVEQIVKCKKCGLVYVNPRFKTSIIVGGYSSAIDHDYISQEKARIKTFMKCLSVLNLYSGQRGKLLDIGAAAGYFVKVAQDDGWKAEGVEPSHWMAKYAQKLGVKVQPGTIHDNKFKAGSFDAVTYWDVLEHVPNPLMDLKKTNKLLRKGGTLIVNYPDLDSLPAKIFKRKWWFILSIHLWYFTPKTIAKLLNKTGFKVIKIQPHIQSLELGYLTYRLKPYSEVGYKFLHSIFRFLGLLEFCLPYYAGQTMVIARKK